MSNKQKTILIISPFFSPNVGGVETRFDNITDYLDKHGYRVWVQTYQPIVTKDKKGAKYEKRGKNIEIWRTWWPGGDLFHKLLKKTLLCAIYLCPGLLWKSFWFLLRHKKEIDVIHTPGLNAALITRILYPVFKIPYVVSIHALYNMPNNTLPAKFICWALNNSRKVLALSEKSKQDIINIGVSPDKVGIHINWIDIDKFKPLNKEDCKKKLGLEEKFVITFIGRLKKIKGIEIVLDLAKMIKEPNIQIVVAGDGDMAEKVRNATDNNNNITFLGNIDNNRLPEIYNSADIGLVPSIYPEGFSRVVIETVCCGIPLIASNMGCIPEEVDNSCSILIEPTVENFYNACMELYNNDKKRKLMATNARKYGELHYSNKNMSSILEAYGFKTQQKV